ncbi:MAG: RsmB/NOP family class I SAM-dependent RNA methyltransferase [Clostridia bacterium]|nr:RsmB/NOP family class I SAM-dependent RNA methyltransferase [Clostridia bacterium]
MQLPQAFLERIRSYLSEDDYNAFVSSYDTAPEKGIRLNTMKCSREKFEELLGDSINPSPFSEKSYYIGDDFKVGTNPLHSAGAFYAQEPSASSAVTVLDPQPGEYILDMCAAPGGKSTQIAAQMQGEGILFSNEVVKSRANILLSNVERMGIKNCVVTSSFPEKYAQILPEFFDRIMVDAPCSGEGMFRKNNDAITEWSPEHVETCAVRQRAILNDAATCLKPGGIMVYSTCTFSKEENEDTVKHFLETHDDFELVPIEVNFGRQGLDNLPVLRIFPMDGGEGHFVAKFRKKGELLPNIPYMQKKQGKQEAEILREIARITTEQWGNIFINKDKIYLHPVGLPDLKGLNVLRAGVLFGEMLKNRIEPAHQFFMAADPDKIINKLDLSYDSRDLNKFYHGEEIPCECRGYTAVCVEGITTGFGKASGGMLKNKYPKGLRHN